MITTRLMALSTVLVLLSCAANARAASEEDGIALAVVYDTSGSMKDHVQDANGRPTPRYVIANRGLEKVTSQLQAFLTNTPSGAPRRIDAALFVFRGNEASEVVHFGPFNPGAFRKWAREFKDPKGNTPLGNALEAAAQRVLQSPLPRKHVLILTDGINTAGPQPAAVLARLQKSRGQEAGFSVHFLAFDVSAAVFDGVKKLGATVVSAENEQQLNTQLDFILKRKILLEEEEPPRQN